MMTKKVLAHSSRKILRVLSHICFVAPKVGALAWKEDKSKMLMYWSCPPRHSPYVYYTHFPNILKVRNHQREQKSRN